MLGVVAAAVLVLFARKHGRRREILVYSIVLVLTAFAYLLFGLRRGTPPEYFAVEAVGTILYTAAAVVGVRRWPFVLALGWTSHVAWDLLFHYANGPAFAPPWYPLLCVGFDLFLGGYIAGAVAKAKDDHPVGAAEPL
jgi:peptidoglycan/LPS O-acetylase OafA/YrhL